MGKAYSLDLRERCIAYIEGGGRCDETSRLFNVSLKTITNWCKLKREKGDLSAAKTGPKGGSRKIDERALIAFITKNPHRTLNEYGDHFSVSYRTIHQTFERLGITHKKTLASTGNAMNKSERHIWKN